MNRRSILALFGASVQSNPRNIGYVAFLVSHDIPLPVVGTLGISEFFIGRCGIHKFIKRAHQKYPFCIFITLILPEIIDAVSIASGGKVVDKL